MRPLWPYIAAIAAAMALSILASLSIGPYSRVGLLQVLSILRLRKVPETDFYIILYRLTRTVAAVALGSALAASGITLQYTLRNPLVDPYLAGVASGALLGVIAMIYTGHAAFLELYAAAIAGGLVTLVAVTLVSLMVGGGPSTFLITGVSASYILSGISMFMMIQLGPKITGTLYWLFGSVAFVTYPVLIRSVVPIVASIAGMLVMAKYINTFMLGDDVARSLGVKINAVRGAAFVLASLATAATVAMAGPVGFVGLVSPWLARRVVGSNFFRALALSAIIGSELTLVSDIIARIVIYPSEAPLTAVTSVFGAPLLVYILLKSRRGEAW